MCWGSKYEGVGWDNVGEHFKTSHVAVGKNLYNKAI